MKQGRSEAEALLLFPASPPLKNHMPDHEPRRRSAAGGSNARGREKKRGFEEKQTSARGNSPSTLPEAAYKHPRKTRRSLPKHPVPPLERKAMGKGDIWGEQTPPTFSDRAGASQGTGVGRREKENVSFCIQKKMGPRRKAEGLGRGEQRRKNIAQPPRTTIFNRINHDRKKG